MDNLKRSNVVTIMARLICGYPPSLGDHFTDVFMRGHANVRSRFQRQSNDLTIEITGYSEIILKQACNNESVLSFKADRCKCINFVSPQFHKTSEATYYSYSFVCIVYIWWFDLDGWDVWKLTLRILTDAAKENMNWKYFQTSLFNTDIA